MSPRTWMFAGAVLGALAVGAGAFGAHALKEQLKTSGKIDVYETAARYQMYHALALVLVGLIGLHRTSICLNIAGVSFVAGVIIFSGLLYVIALGGPTTLGRIVPIGGAAMIAGWVALAIAAMKLAKQ